MAINRLMSAALGGPPFPMRGDGTQARSFTFVDDVAEATVAAVTQRTVSSVFNIGGGDVVSVLDLIGKIERLAGTTIPVERFPGAPGDPARTAADVSRAERELQWRPTTAIDAGLAAQWQWQAATARRRTATPA